MKPFSDEYEGLFSSTVKQLIYAKKCHRMISGRNPRHRKATKQTERLTVLICEKCYQLMLDQITTKLKKFIKKTRIC